MKLSLVEKLYEFAGDARIVHHEVAAGLFADFSRAVTEAMTEAGEDVEDDEAWSPLLRYLRRLRFALSSTPLWLAHPSRHHCVGRLAGRDELMRSAELSRPTALRALREAFAYADEMHGEGSSELRSAAGELATDAATGPLGFLIKSPRFTACSEGSLQQELRTRGVDRDFVVLTPSELRVAPPLETLIVFGPTMWYPPHLTGTPHARTIHILKHEWIRDQAPPRLHFAGAGVRDVPSRVTEHRRRRATTGAPRRSVEVEGSDLLPTVDIRRLRELSAEGERDEGAAIEEARVYLLEGEMGVFLSADGASSRFTIDLDERAVKRLPVRDIEEGTFLVLRTEGGGDYVRTTADVILGVKAEALRAAQESWKHPLRVMIARCGSYRRAAQVLNNMGVPQATPQNIARWASAENICTQDESTFRSLAAALDVDYDPSTIWAKMVEIRHAHTTAGATIQKKLHERVQDADLSQLQARGVMEFTLDDVDAGTLTAYRVNQVGTDVWEVESSQLGRPFPLES